MWSFSNKERGSYSQSNDIWVTNWEKKNNEDKVYLFAAETKKQAMKADMKREDTRRVGGNTSASTGWKQ